jgi:hypothetical protein
MADIGTLNPEQMLQQQQILRQQKMAEMLMQQGMQQPQGQMVGGRYVAPSIFQNIAGLANTYVGQRGIEKAEQAQIDLAKAIRQGDIAATADFMKTKQGSPAEMFAAQAGPMPDGSNIPIQESRAAIAPNPQAAFANLAVDPRASARLQNIGFNKMFADPESFTLNEGAIRFEKQADGTTKQVAAGGQKPRAPLQIDTGTAIELRDPNNPTIVLQRIPKSISPADAIRMNFEGMNTGGGMPMGNVPAAGGMPIANAQPAKDKFAPAVQPQYQYNPSLSPKANQEAAAKFAETAVKNQTNAKDSFDLMKSASALLSSEAPSSGRLSNIVTGTREFFGGGGEASKADAQLNLLSGALTMKQPRFEGPQGVLDVILYQKLAGDLGNPNIPVPSRLATINQMIDLQKKYYPEGDWDSISTKTQGDAKTQAARSAGKVSVGAPQYAVNPTTGERIVSTDGGINWKPTRNK